MASNPNPSRITDATWRVWEETAADTPGVRLGGIYADKRCYHNTVNNNLANWPGAYCVRLALDLTGDLDKARAIDWTMSDAEMVKRTKRLRDSALDPNDDRLLAVREFYGTLDNRNVYGLIKDSEYGRWRSSTSDPSHLWHIHLSIFTKYISMWVALSGIVSVWVGEPLDQWTSKDQGGIMLPSIGDRGEVVRYWQRMLREVGVLVAADGVYGNETRDGVRTFHYDIAGGTRIGFTGDEITSWVAVQLQKRVFRGLEGPQGPKGPAGPAGTLPARICIDVPDLNDIVG